MVPLFKNLVDRFLHDAVFVRRWTRAALGAFATGGAAFAEQLALVVGDGSPYLTKTIRLASVAAAFVALAINLGEKNPPEIV